SSPIPAHFDALEDLVYLYLDLLDALDMRNVVLMGFAMGGWIAAELAVRNTTRLAQLILVDAVGIKPGDRDTRDIADVFGAPAPAVAKLLFHDPSKAPDLAAMTDAQVTVLAGDRIAHAMYTWDPYMHNPKLRYRLHRITIPTLLMWGASDGVVPVTYAEAYCTMIPGAQLVIIPEAGHLPHVEQPELLLQHVLSFTARGGGRLFKPGSLPKTPIHSFPRRTRTSPFGSTCPTSTTTLSRGQTCIICTSTCGVLPTTWGSR